MTDTALNLAMDALLAARQRFVPIDPNWDKWHLFPAAIEAINAAALSAQPQPDVHPIVLNSKAINALTCAHNALHHYAEKNEAIQFALVQINSALSATAHPVETVKAAVQPVAWMHVHESLGRVPDMQQLGLGDFDNGWTEYPLYSQATVAALEAERDEAVADTLAAEAELRIVRSKFEKAELALAECQKREAGLREAATNLIANRFDHYKARNGKMLSIEGDDGEKCWIVSFDDMVDLEAALTCEGA